MKLQTFINQNAFIHPFKLKALIKAKFKTTLSNQVFKNRLKRAKKMVSIDKEGIITKLKTEKK